MIAFLTWRGFNGSELDITRMRHSGIDNAILIAAAPDLLAALEALHACHRSFSSNDNWTTLDDDARAFSESAIAKAKGTA